MELSNKIPEITVTYSHPNKSKIKVTSSLQAYEIFKTFFPVDSMELQERFCSIKSTERYLHVNKETLINIPNVLDELNKPLL